MHYHVSLRGGGHDDVVLKSASMSYVEDVSNSCAVLENKTRHELLCKTSDACRMRRTGHRCIRKLQFRWGAEGI